MLLQRRPNEAIEKWKLAKKIYEKLEMQAEVADLEKQIGLTLRSRGLRRHKEALKHLENAKNIYEKLEMPKSLADMEETIGICLNLGDRKSEALKHYDAAKTIYEKLKMLEEALNVENEIGNLLSVRGRHVEALDKYEAVLPLWEYLGSPINQATALRNIGISKMKLGDWDGASQELNRAFELMEWVKHGVKSPELQRNLREKYLIVNDALCVNSFFRWEKVGDWGFLNEALNYIELAKCSSVAESLELGGGSALCPEMEKLTIMQDKLLNKWEENYARRVQNRKLQMDGQIDQVEFKTIRKDLDEDYDTIQKEVDRLRSEVLVKCADFGITSIPRTYNILKRMFNEFPRNERWCILEFGISDILGKMFVFLVSMFPRVDGVPQVFCEVNSVDFGEIKELSMRCREIIKTLRKHAKGKWAKADKELKDLSDQLYAALIPEEIGKTLKIWEKRGYFEHLIIVPHKFLHYVPFEILHDGNDYWGIKYAISTNFSLDLARLCLEKRKKGALKLKESPFFLMVKNPLNDLKGADESVERLVRLLDAQNIKFEELKHKDVTQTAFIVAAKELPFDVLHYAGHGVFMGKYPSLSALFLHTDEEFCIACEEGKRHEKWDLFNATEFIDKIKFKRTPIVFLLGCETGIAEIELGDEMFGLVRALMYAGATSLILSRWVVRGKIAPVFTKEFYRWLLGGASVAVALWCARRKVYNPNTSNFTDWAAFFVSGDPFRRLT